MQIEKGKYYRDRTGKKVGPMVTGIYFCWQKGHGEGVDAEWSPEGEMKMPGHQGYGDLVAEWVEGERTPQIIVAEIDDLMAELRAVLS